MSFVYIKMLVAIVAGSIIAVITLPYVLGLILGFINIGALGKGIFTILWNSFVIGTIASVLWGWE